MDARTESERLARLADRDEQCRELEPEWRARVVADPFSLHEALHVADLFSRMVDEHLLAHPVILLHPHPYELADRAVAALAELYQAVGKLSDHEDGRM